MPRENLLRSLHDTLWIAKPPLFRLLVYFWSFLGDTEFILRLLPVIFGILAIILMYKLGKMLFDESIALVAAFLLSISPFHIHYSQELTHYSLIVFLSLCSVYYLVLSLKENRINLWIKFILFTSLSLYSSYICLFLLITENIFFLISYSKYKKLSKRWLISQAAILLLFSPWLILISRQFFYISLYPYSYNWIPRGSLTHIFQELRLFNAGYNANFIIHLFASILFFSLFLTGILAVLRRGIQKTKILILWLFAPMVLSILFSKVLYTFTYRNFILALPAYYFLVAAGVFKFKRSIPLFIISFAILSGLSLFNYYKNIFPYPATYYPGICAKQDFRSASKYVIRNYKEGDIVIHTCLSSETPYRYYLFFKGNKIHTNDYSTSGEKNYITINNKEEIPEIIEGRKRIWLVFSSWNSRQLVLYPSMEENRIKEALDNNFVALGRKEFEGVEVHLYKIAESLYIGNLQGQR